MTSRGLRVLGRQKRRGTRSVRSISPGNGDMACRCGTLLDVAPPEFHCRCAARQPLCKVSYMNLIPILSSCLQEVSLVPEIGLDALN